MKASTDPIADKGMTRRSPEGATPSRIPALGLAALLLFLSTSLEGQGRQLGIAGRSAPAWNLTWLNLPEQRPRLEVEDFRGAVLYLFCFQSWCPGCHSHGFPTLQEVERHYRGRGDVHFVAVQTVFEGFGTNTARRALDELADYGLDIPLAHDAGQEGLSPFMRAYRTGGTPWSILIDRQGKVVWNGFQIEAEQAIGIIDRLLAEPPPPVVQDSGRSSSKP